MSELIIIPVIENELEKLKYLSIKTFQETFSDQNTDDNMNEYLKLNMNSCKLLNELKNPNTEFYFVYNKSSLLGYLKLNRQLHSRVQMNLFFLNNLKRIILLNFYTLAL